MKRKQKIIIGTIIAVLIIVFSLLFFYFDGQKAVSAKSEEVVVEISGSTSTVINQLDQAGLIKNKWLLMFMQNYINMILLQMFMF